jgi:actin-related protein
MIGQAATNAVIKGAKPLAKQAIDMAVERIPIVGRFVQKTQGPATKTALDRLLGAKPLETVPEKADVDDLAKRAKDIAQIESENVEIISAEAAARAQAQQAKVTADTLEKARLERNAREAARRTAEEQAAAQREFDFRAAQAQSDLDFQSRNPSNGQLPLFEPIPAPVARIPYDRKYVQPELPWANEPPLPEYTTPLPNTKRITADEALDRSQALMTAKDEFRRRAAELGFNEQTINDVLKNPTTLDKLYEDMTKSAKQTAAERKQAIDNNIRGAMAEIGLRAAAPAAVRVVAGAVLPEKNRRQMAPRAKYGQPEWSQQLKAAGLSDKEISDIENGLARRSYEAKTGGPSASMRMQRPVEFTEEMLAQYPTKTAAEMARSQIKVLDEYRRRTGDDSVVPEMARLGIWISRQ